VNCQYIVADLQIDNVIGYVKVPEILCEAVGAAGCGARVPCGCAGEILSFNFGAVEVSDKGVVIADFQFHGAEVVRATVKSE